MVQKETTTRKNRKIPPIPKTPAFARLEISLVFQLQTQGVWEMVGMESETTDCESKGEKEKTQADLEL